MRQSLLKFCICISLVFAGFIATAQEKTVSGSVKEANGVPVPGVGILIKGTKQST